MRKYAFTITNSFQSTFVDSQGNPARPEFHYGDTVVLGFSIRELGGVSTPYAFDLTGYTALRVTIRAGRKASATLYAQQTAFNQGDWTFYEDLPAGKFSSKISLTAEAIGTALAGDDDGILTNAWLEVSALDASANPSTLAQFPIRILDQVDDGAAGTPTPSSPTYYTAVEVLALLEDYLQLAGGTMTGNLNLDSNEAQNALLTAVKQIDFDAATELTVAAGAVTATQPVHTVDTEADAAADDLTTISTWTGLLFLRLASAARVVTLTHGTAANQIETSDGAALALTRGLTLLYRKTTSEAWAVLAGGGSAVELPATMSQVEAEAGTSTETRLVTAQRIKQAIDALGGGGGGGGSPVSDNWIHDGTQATSGASYTISGLSLQPGKQYRLFADIIASANMSIRLWVNADETDANYRSHSVTSTGSDAVAGGNASQAFICDPLIGEALITCLVTVSQDGRATIATTMHQRTSTTSRWQASTLIKTATVTSITSLKFAADGGNINATSLFRLCELRDVTGGGAVMPMVQFTGSTMATPLTAGAWRTMVVDGESIDTDGLVAAPASNQMTLPAGTWRFETSCDIYRGDYVDVRLYDVTNSAQLGALALHCNGGYYSATNAVIVGRFTLAASAAIELQAWPWASNMESGHSVNEPSSPGRIITFYKEA